MSIPVEKLFQAYGAYLRAKVALVGADGFPDVVLGARKDIADYEALEREWVAHQVAVRQRRTDAFVAELEAIERLHAGKAK